MSKLWENEELSENILRIIDQNKKHADKKKSKNFYFYENFSLEKYNYSLGELKTFFSEVLPEAKNIQAKLNELAEKSVEIKKAYGEGVYNQRQCELEEEQKCLFKEKLVRTKMFI